MWDIHKIIHDFSTTIDGLYMGDTRTLQLVTPLYISATIQANSAAIQQAIQQLIHSYYHVLLLCFSGYIPNLYHTLSHYDSCLILCKNTACFPSYLYNIQVFI